MDIYAHIFADQGREVTENIGRTVFGHDLAKCGNGDSRKVSTSVFSEMGGIAVDSSVSTRQRAEAQEKA